MISPSRSVRSSTSTTDPSRMPVCAGRDRTDRSGVGPRFPTGRKAGGDEKDRRGTGLLEQSIGATGGGQTHPAWDASGFDPIAGKNETHSKHGRPPRKKLKRTVEVDPVGYGLVENQLAGCWFPCGYPTGEFGGTGQDDLKTFGKTGRPIGRAIEDQFGRRISLADAGRKRPPGKRFGPVDRSFRIFSEAIGEGPARIDEKFPSLERRRALVFKSGIPGHPSAQDSSMVR